MNTTTSAESPPKSTDLEGWRAAIAAGSIAGFRTESVVAAFQDLGSRDPALRNALAKYLSDSLTRILRWRIGVHHPNRGDDLILRAHGDIFAALLTPASADGRGLREAFMPRVLFRIKDAIASETRERGIPDETIDEENRKSEEGAGAHSGKMAKRAVARIQPEALLQGEAAPARHPDSSLFDGVAEADEQIDVNRILECVPDSRKRLAFHLYMNGVPFKSKRKGVESIARAVGVSERTARDWIDEVRQLLAGNKNVKKLKALKAGETI